MCCKTVLFFDKQTCVFYHKHFFTFCKQGEGKRRTRREKLNTHVIKTYLTLKFYFHEEMMPCDADSYTLPKSCIIMSKCNTLFEQVQQDRSFFKNLK